jgi:DNA-binding winged helix-turn-helix (wHTH) protein
LPGNRVKSHTLTRNEMAGGPACICAHFDCFEVDLSSGELRKGNGAATRIQPKPLQVRRLLLESGGRVVSREQLRAALWPEQTFVDSEHGINTAVKKLRQALDDSVENPRYIETLPKIGYRFLASVEWNYYGNQVVAPSVTPVVPVEEQTSTEPGSQFRHWRLVAAIALAIVLAVVAFFIPFSRISGNLLARLGIENRLARQIISERRLTANPDEGAEGIPKKVIRKL